jgi:hypothetical protein
MQNIKDQSLAARMKEDFPKETLPTQFSRKSQTKRFRAGARPNSNQELSKSSDIESHKQELHKQREV